jgi:predicted DCC family thiol-disulfide oxidoreductase YuxK
MSCIVQDVACWLLLRRQVKYLYDGDCAMCRSLKNVLERQDNRRGLISFIDISSGLELQP